MSWILIKDIRLPITETSLSATEFAQKILSPLIGKNNIINLQIYKKSIDSRRRRNISVVWSVAAKLAFTPSDDFLKKTGFSILADSKLHFTFGSEPLRAPPVIVGFGPAGMFAALVLAKNGYSPVIIERGDDTPQRAAAVEKFYKTKILDPESNIQFGAGGAGTFSDGKLVTRINDNRCRYVLQKLTELGAPEDILTQAKPHIGTDILRNVVSKMKDRIIALGGKIIFRCSFLSSVCDSSGKITSVKTSKGEINCGALIMACGHSAVDVYSNLISDEFTIVEKPLSVGLRIEHLRSDVELALFGSQELARLLGSAEYAYSHRKDGRAVYTFCMCPGGEVVAASSENGALTVNGMSRHARDMINSNSALAVSVTPEDCKPFGGTMAFRRMLEQKTFSLGGGNFCAPVQTVGDFLSNRAVREPSKIIPSYMGGNQNCKVANLSSIFPEYISDMLKEGIVKFNSQMRGFSDPDAVLTGTETRTSAPYRIVRTEDGTSPNHDNFYPCGEGAGYAGGITSAAVDGIFQAQNIISRYSPPKDLVFKF